MSKNSTVTEKKPAKPRLTNEERKAARDAQEQEAEARRQQAWALFEGVRPQKWLELWAKALRLELLAQAYPEVVAQNRWWFGEFRVNAQDQTFSTGASTAQSQDTLHPSEVERLHRSFDDALAWIDEYEVQQEQIREEERILAQQRAVALAKLSAEDKKALGIL